MKELKTIREAIKAILDGNEVEFRSTERGEWSPLENLFISFDCIDDESDYEFRIKTVKPSIDWDHVHPRYNYLARDKNGIVSLFEEGPSKITSTWRSNGGGVCRATTHSSLTVGNCEWYESLVERPKDKE